MSNNFNVKVMRLMNRIRLLYLRYTNPVKWAKQLGVILGEGTTLPPDTSFPSEPYLITIGKNVQITSQVKFFTHGGAHVGRTVYDKFDFFGKIVVGDNSYIGCGAMIMPGVSIGEHTLVAAGSVVTKSTPPNTVVGGNPAKVICTISEFLDKNLKYNVDIGGGNFERKKAILLSLPDDKFVNK